MQKLDKKIISFVLIAILILANFAPIVNAAGDEIVTIKDEKLLESIMYYDKNSDGKLSKSEMENITDLYISPEVTDLTGLEYATNVRDLSVCFASDSLDFSKMSLDKVDSLMLQYYDSVDLSIIEKCSNITYLNINTYQMASPELKNLNKCTKLERLNLNNILFSNFTKLSGLTNLEFIHMRYDASNEKVDTDLTGIENLVNLKEIEMTNANFKNINSLGKLSQLTRVELSNNTGIADLSCLANCKDMKHFVASYSDLSDISFVKDWNKLDYINVAGTKIKDASVLQGKPIQYAFINGTNIPTAELANLFTLHEYTAYVGEKVNIGQTADGIFDPMCWTYESDNENVVKMVRDSQMQAVETGTANIKVMAEDKVYHTVKINVVKSLEDTTLGKDATSQFVESDMVLKANGDLLKIYATEGKAEKVDSNVKKHVYGFVYEDDYDEFGYKYTFTSKKDGTVKYVFNGIETEMKDIEDVSDGGYLANGIFYQVQVDGTCKQTLENVEKIVEDYLVTKDGKTYDKSGNLIANFAIKKAASYYIVDENNCVWTVSDGKAYSTEMNSFKEFAMPYVPLHFSQVVATQEGELRSIYGGDYIYDYRTTLHLGSYNEIRVDKDFNLTLNGEIILSDVRSIMTINNQNGDNAFLMIIRRDGTLWELALDGTAKLAKVQETSGRAVFADDSGIKTRMSTFEDEFMPRDHEIITGFDIKKLAVRDALASSSFQEGYTAKAYKDDKELEDNQKISTGTKVQILNSKGEVVAEYTALIYGDVTGKGNPGVADALMIVKNKIGKVKIEGNLFMEAGRVTEATRKKAGVPGVADALAIIKAKLGRYEISI